MEAIDELRGPELITEVVIVRSDSATVDDAGFRQIVETLTGDIRALGNDIVTGVASF